MIENSKKPIPVLVSGALGRMGSEVVNTVLNSTDCELVAAIDINEKNNGSNISELLKVKNCDVFVSTDFEGTLCSVSQKYRNENIKPVLVDFTHPDSVYENIELIEMHHNQKADSPSGTCIKTAEMIEEYPKKFNQNLVKESESLKGVRGGVRDSGINIHSVRLPGLLAHQLVIMGSPGETYT